MTNEKKYDELAMNVTNDQCMQIIVQFPEYFFSKITKELYDY